MAYQPTNPYPYMEVIDATKANQFSCQISDRDIVTGATIQIFNESEEISHNILTLPSVAIGWNRYFDVENELDTNGKTVRGILNDYMDKGYTLAVKDNNGDFCVITKLQRYMKYTRIYANGSFTQGKTYEVYSNSPIEITVPLNKPIYGGSLESSVLSHSVDAKVLQNGIDYSWNLVLTLDEKNIMSSGNVDSMSNDFKLVYVPYSLALYERLSDDLSDTYISLYNPQEDFAKDVKLDTSKNVISGANALLGVYITELSDGEKNKLGISDVSENLGSHLLYHVYKGNVSLSTSKYHFKTRQTPVLNFNDVPSEIHSDEYTFRANYYQNDGTQFAYYQFDLYQNDELIDSSDQQNSRLIQYTFHGLMNQADYRLVLTVVDDDGVETIAEHLFTVDYNLLQSTITPKTEVDNFNGCIKVDYSNHVPIPGKPSDENSIDLKNDYGISISDNTSLLWDEMSSKPLNIPTPSCQVIRWHGKHGFSGTIAEVYDAEFPWNATSISFDGNKFVAKQRRGTGVVEEHHSIYNNEKAWAIAGRDAYSVLYSQASYNGETTISLNGAIQGELTIESGQWIQVGNEHRKVKFDSEKNEITIDRPLSQNKGYIDLVVYKEDYIYALNDNDEITDNDNVYQSDILIDNDQVSKYWWLIVIYPPSNEKIVEIHKSQIFTEESEG